MNTKYERLDCAIINALDKRYLTFSELESMKNIELITRMYAEGDRLNIGLRVPAFRYLDRRLQALRKQGKIEFKARKWGLA